MASVTRETSGNHSVHINVLHVYTCIYSDQLGKYIFKIKIDALCNGKMEYPVTVRCNTFLVQLICGTVKVVCECNIPLQLFARCR